MDVYQKYELMEPLQGVGPKSFRARLKGPGTAVTVHFLVGGQSPANQATVLGFVPLSEMFGYINFLRSATSGRGTFTMEFDHYSGVPAGLVQKLMEAEA